jgi:hypothetical protein
MKSHLIINCPAPYYIQHTVCHYEQAKDEGRRVGIIVTDTRPVFGFLQSLNLDLDFLEFFACDPKAILLGTPLHTFQSRIYYQKMCYHFSKRLQDRELWYFGSHNVGPICCLVATAIRLGSKVVNVGWPANDTRFHRDPNLRMFVRRQMLQWVTRSKLRYASLGESENYRNLLLIDESKMGIKLHSGNPEPAIPQKFFYCVSDFIKSGKTILLLDGRDEDNYHDYEVRMREIVGHFRTLGWRVVLKPHPRVGSSAFFEEIVDDIVPAFVPAQFLKRTSFHVVISNISAAMGTFANEGIPTISLEFLHARKVLKERDYFVSMLRNPEYFPDPQRQIQFPKSVADLLLCLESRDPLSPETLRQ